MAKKAHFCVEGEASQNFKMMDVGGKRPTHRQAVASGKIFMNQEAFQKLKSGTLPKGNVLALSEIAGITGAKTAFQMIPLCHPLSLEQATIHHVLNDGEGSVTAYCQVVAFEKTGVEMEALAGVNAALLSLWDLLKGTDPALEISDIKLLSKTGGKSGVWLNPQGVAEWLTQQLPRSKSLQGKTAAVLVMSDRASQGIYQDESGESICRFLKDEGAEIKAYHVISDDFELIKKTLSGLCTDVQPDLLVASGGTGPGPRDVTPEALAEVSDRLLDGFGDYLRAQSLYFTDTAWLSRMTAAMIGKTFVIALPGSPKAVSECWGIIQPFLGDALEKIAKQGYRK